MAARKFVVTVTRGALALARECGEPEMEDTARALLDLARGLASEYPEVNDTPRVEHVGAGHIYGGEGGSESDGRRRLGFRA